MHTQRQDYHPKEYLGPHPDFSLEYLDRGFDRPKDLRARCAYGNMQTEPIAAVPVYRIVYDCGQRCYRSEAESDDGNDADNADNADDADDTADADNADNGDSDPPDINNRRKSTVDDEPAKDVPPPKPKRIRRNRTNAECKVILHVSRIS